MRTFLLRLSDVGGRSVAVEMRASERLLAVAGVAREAFGLMEVGDERWGFYMSGEHLDFDTELSAARRARAGTAEVALETLGLAEGMRFLYAHDGGLIDVDVVGSGEVEDGADRARVIEALSAAATPEFAAATVERVAAAQERLQQVGPRGVDRGFARELVGVLYAITEACPDRAALAALGTRLGRGAGLTEWLAQAADAVIVGSPDLPGLGPLLRRWMALGLVPGAPLLVARHLDAGGAADEALALLAEHARPGTLPGDEITLALARLLARRGRLREAEARVGPLLGRRWLSGRLRRLAERVLVELTAVSGRTAEARTLERQLSAGAQQREERLEGTVRRAGPKVGRNDPCPCGSGKKWKRCCGQGG